MGETKTEKILKGILYFALGVFAGLVMSALPPEILSEEQIPYVALFAGIVVIYAFACLKLR